VDAIITDFKKILQHHNNIKFALFGDNFDKTWDTQKENIRKFVKEIEIDGKPMYSHKLAGLLQDRTIHSCGDNSSFNQSKNMEKAKVVKPRTPTFFPGEHGPQKAPTDRCAA
jgi:hypothetical protein